MKRTLVKGQNGPSLASTVPPTNGSHPLQCPTKWPLKSIREIVCLRSETALYTWKGKSSFLKKPKYVFNKTWCLVSGCLVRVNSASHVSPWCGMLQLLEDPELLVKVSPWAEFLKV